MSVFNLPWHLKTKCYYTLKLHNFNLMKCHKCSDNNNSHSYFINNKDGHCS